MFRIGEHVIVSDKHDSLFNEVVEIVSWDPLNDVYEVQTTIVPKYITFYKGSELSRSFVGLSEIVSYNLPPLPAQTCTCSNISLGCRCEYGKLELEKERSKNGTV
jgi:hypothetical protein